MLLTVKILPLCTFIPIIHYLSPFLSSRLLNENAQDMKSNKDILSLRNIYSCCLFFTEVKLKTDDIIEEQLMTLYGSDSLFEPFIKPHACICAVQILSTVFYSRGLHGSTQYQGPNPGNSGPESGIHQVRDHAAASGVRFAGLCVNMSDTWMDWNRLPIGSNHVINHDHNSFLR